MQESNGSRPDAEHGYEELTAQLEEVLALLEGGELPLDTALATYERGVTLVRQCNDLLDRAELRIAELSGSVRPDGDQESLFDYDFDDEE
jgi:exodeoxyribonuclease VII small subunit